MLASVFANTVFSRVLTSSDAISFLRLMRTALVVLGCTLLGSRTACAAELHFRNGDRLTGELVRRDDGKIYFRSAVLGEVMVNEVDAAIVETAETPVESLAGLPPAPKTHAKSTTATAPTTPATGGAGGPPANAVAASAAKPVEKTPAGSTTTTAKIGRWKGKVEFGYQQQTGRQDALNTSVRADVEREGSVDTIKSSLRVLYGELNDRTTSDRADASFRWRHQLSPKVFGQAVTSYLTDNIKQIDQNYEQNVGIGYALLKRDRHVINLGGGLTGQYREAQGIEGGFAALGEFFEDYTYRFNGRLTFLQDMLAQYSPKSRDSYTIVNGTLTPTDGDEQNYKIRFNTTLQGKITERISMNLRFEYEFDNAIPNEDAKTDQRITSSLGYAF